MIVGKLSSFNRGWIIGDFENSLLQVSYHYICSVLLNEYGLNDDNIEQLLTKLLHKYTNNGQLKISL